MIKEAGVSKEGAETSRDATPRQESGFGDGGYFVVSVWAKCAATAFEAAWTDAS